MRFARPWLTTLGLLLLAGGLLAAPCSSLARCCGVMRAGPAGHTTHSAEAATQHTSSQGTSEMASHCAVSKSSKSSEPLFGLSSFDRSCSKCGPALLPVSGKRSLKASQANALSVATAVSVSPGVETEEFRDRHRYRCRSGALYELHCALLI